MFAHFSLQHTTPERNSFFSKTTLKYTNTYTYKNYVKTTHKLHTKITHIIIQTYFYRINQFILNCNVIKEIWNMFCSPRTYSNEIIPSDNKSLTKWHHKSICLDLFEDFVHFIHLLFLGYQYVKLWHLFTV